MYPRTERLRPEDINEETRKITCDSWVDGIEFHSYIAPNPAKLMKYVYEANTVETLREKADRENSGLYVTRCGQVIMAAAFISLQEETSAPRYDDPRKPTNPMYMGHLGIAIDNGDWRRHFRNIVKTARLDLGDSERGVVTGLGMYVNVNNDNELPEAVRRLNPKTYKVFGEEAGVDGRVDGVPGNYRLHTVEFTKGVGRAGLFGARKFLTSRFPHLGDIRLDSTRPAPAAPEREKVPVAA